MSQISGYSGARDLFSVLVVDSSLADLISTAAALSAGPFDVTTAASFEQAKNIIAKRAPDLLVAAVRLGEYNGLHLVLRGKAVKPQMAAIVTCPAADPVLCAEADAMRTTFVVTPIEGDELLAAALRTLYWPPGSDDGIRPPFERRRLERRQAQHSTLTGPNRRVKSERRRLATIAAARLLG